MSSYYIVTFAEFATFAAQQPDLFEALFIQRERDLSEADLVALVERHRRREGVSVSTATVVRKLKELRVLEDSASGDVGSSYRYADPLADLHEYLAQTLAPISPESIAGAIVSLEKLIGEMEQARAAFDATVVESRAREMRQRSTQVLKGIEANYRHIMNEAASIRSDAARLTAKERFTRLERAWMTYIHPLVQIVNVNGMIERVIQQAERIVEQAEDEGLFAVPGQAEATLRRFVVLRQRSNARIQDCVQTIRPILERHRQESLASQGASLVIDRMLQHGGYGQGIETLMPVLWVSPRDQYSDDQILACARNIHGITPTEPPVLNLAFGTTANLPDHADPSMLAEAIEALRAAGEVPDVWQFLREKFPDRSALHCLAVFYNLQADLKDAVVRFPGEIKSYDFPDANMTAGVASVAITK